MSSEKIIVRSVNWLGDAVMSIPALLRLREAHPTAEISILSPEKLADLWHRHPAINAVHSFAKDESVWSIARRLRSGSFSVGIAFPNSIRSALELWLARIPRRVGYSGEGRSWLLTDSIRPRSGAVRMQKKSIAEINRSLRSNAPTVEHYPRHVETHQIYHYLHLVSFMGACPQPVPPSLFVDEDEVQTFLRRWKIEPSSLRPILGLNPGAEYGPAKRWPAEKFVQAAVAIQKTLRCQWLIFGGLADVELASILRAQIERALQNKLPRTGAPAMEPVVRNLAGRTTLRELCAGLKVCRVLLTNDSGPMHLAAALGTKLVALYGSTSPELTGPGIPQAPGNLILKSNAACSPCFLRECPIDFRCMKDITVEQVTEAVITSCETNASELSKDS